MYKKQEAILGWPPVFYMLFTVFFFDSSNHVHTALVAFSQELSVQPLLYNHLGQFRAYHTGAKGQNVGVIVLLGELSGVRLTANHSPDPGYLIGRQGDSYAGAADEDTPVAFAGNYGVCYRFSVNRIVTAIVGVGAEILALISLAFDKFHDFFF
jgi:hypothetical protein